MAKVQINLDNKKYIMEFLPDNQVKIIQTGNEDKVITVQYFSDTKVCNFMEYIKSLDFSKLEDKTLYIIGRKVWNKGDPSGCISKNEWIDKDYPCTYRAGLAYKGAESSFITKNDALKKFGHTFSAGFEQKGGIWVLNFQDYSENDLY